jgi:hypothetical protein
MGYHINESELPRINLNHEEWTDIIVQLLSDIDSTFDFNSFVKSVAYLLVKKQKGFTSLANTSYEPNLQWNDVGKIREIIWDLIIQRYITIGGNGNDNWPALSVTNRGKVYFASVHK